MKAALIEKKGCRKGAKMHPFAHTLVAVKELKPFWNDGGDDETRTRYLCRDSALFFGNCLKLRGTDGYQNRALEPQVTIIGP